MRILPTSSVFSTAVSGMRSAEARLATSAHNVANLGTPAFRPLRGTQESVEGGGSRVLAGQEVQSR